MSFELTSKDRSNRQVQAMVSKIYCVDCGKLLSISEKEKNDAIAKKRGIKRLDMCSRCWEDYCHHAITGW